MRISPLSLTRPERPAKVFKLADSNQPGVVFEVKLRSLDAVTMHLSEQIAKETIAKYSELPFPPLMGDQLELSDELIRAAATLMCMQVPTDNEEPYCIEELIALAATMPEVWNQLGAISDVLTLEGPLGKAARALLKDLPGSPSASPSDTLNSTLESTPSSGPSTNDLEEKQVST